MTADTSVEAVQRLLADATSEPWEVDACETIRALLAERDDFVRRETRYITNELRDANDKLATVEAERDAARAEVARLTAIVGHYARAFCEGYCKQTPERARFDHDCAGCKARAALAGEGR